MGRIPVVAGCAFFVNDDFWQVVIDDLYLPVLKQV